MGKFLKEFRAFAMKGNVIDLAIGVIIGSAFGKIVTSLVNDVVMPLLGLLIGQVNLKERSLQLAPNIDPNLKLNYGNFIQSILDFLIIALCIFIAVKAINKVKSRFEKQKETETAAPPAPTKTELLLEEIRDLLKNR